MIDWRAGAAGDRASIDALPDAAGNSLNEQCVASLARRRQVTRGCAFCSGATISVRGKTRLGRLFVFGCLSIYLKVVVEVGGSRFC